MLAKKIITAILLRIKRLNTRVINASIIVVQLKGNPAVCRIEGTKPFHLNTCRILTGNFNRIASVGLICSDNALNNDTRTKKIVDVKTVNKETLRDSNRRILWSRRWTSLAVFLNKVSFYIFCVSFRGAIVAFVTICAIAFALGALLVYTTKNSFTTFAFAAGYRKKQSKNSCGIKEFIFHDGKTKNVAEKQ